MVKVIIEDTGQQLDILDDKITYVKQVGDIGDISKINTSYSWSMKFPKTSRNTQILDGLGLVGSNSRKPYEKVKCTISDNGFQIVNGGLLEINATLEDEYKGNIQDGIIDFYKDIKNDKISPTIDLSSLTHENTVQKIFDSWDMNLPYKYLVANYNGRVLPDINNTTNLDRNGIVPSINVGYLFDKIFEHYGWTYSGIDLNDDWMTYPSAPAPEENPGTVVAELEPQPIGQISHGFHEVVHFTVVGIDNNYAVLNGGVVLTIQQLTTYALEVPEARYVDSLMTEVFVNNQFIESGIGNYTADLGSLDIGYDITIKVIGETYGDEQYGSVTWQGNLKLLSVGGDTINFSKALVKYKVKDFFKEIMIRKSLTSFADVRNRHIEFQNIEQRLNAPVVDYSDKFSERKKESYTYKTYAQNNYLKHKYDKEEGDYADGNITVDNLNLETEQALYESESYAPLEGFVEYHDEGDAYNVPILKMFDIEVKEEDVDNNDTLEIVIDYKPLEERFYFSKFIGKNRRMYVNGNLFHTLPVPIPIAIPQTFDKIVGDKYQTIQRILNDTKIHNIELVLNRMDLATLDLKKRYYFKQESAYYILNKLTWKSGELSTGEFIRIKN